jgi:hypothetical protein
MTASAGSAQALLRQQGDAGESRGVIGQDVGAVGVSGDQTRGRDGCPSCLMEKHTSVGSPTCDLLQFAAGDKSLYICLAALPPRHDPTR